jgi:hypothetical protein
MAQRVRATARLFAVFPKPKGPFASAGEGADLKVVSQGRARYIPKSFSDFVAVVF